MKMAEHKYWNPIIETLPRERLVEIELKRFRETLRWAKESSPFYMQKLHGIEPEDIRTLEDVAKVPLAWLGWFGIKSLTIVVHLYRA